MLLAGCPFPKSSVKSASLTVSINNNINPRTLLPPISMDAASYTVDGAGPNGASFSQSSGGEPVTVEGLTFGTWTVTVSALNAEGTVIGQGQDVATVSVGQNTTMAVTVIPLGGTGDLNLSVSWTASLQFPSIQASLVPPSGPAISLDFGVSGNRADYSGYTIAAGYYTLTLQLRENNIPVMGAVEVVRIVSGQTTSGTFDFSNVNMGTIEVNITPAMANPIPVNISEVPSPIGVGTSLTATASVSDGTANVLYVWYLNGVSQATGESYSFGSTLNRGYYRLDVTAFTADGIRAGSASASFQVGASVPPSLVGSWNFYRAWAKYSGLMEFDANGNFNNWEDYAGTMSGANGTWSLSGDTLTLVFSEGGPGGSLSVPLTWVNANQVQLSIPGQETVAIYRKGFEPDGYLFNNPKYPPITLARDSPAQGNLPSDGLALYQYVAGQNAQDARLSWSINVQIWFYVDEQTTIEPGHPRWSGGTQNAVALVPGHTYYIVVSNRSGLSGDYSIMMTETAYVGTWVNPAYNGGAGKIVLTATSNTFYTNDYDTTPYKSEIFAIVNDWTSGGDRYFKGIGSGGYFLMRVSNNGNTLEVDTKSTVDQVSMDPTSESYVIFAR